MSDFDNRAGKNVIQQQIRLSWARAFEISYTSVKIRFVRSLITAGGIVLAITFLMATWTTSSTLDAVKKSLPSALRDKQNTLTDQAKALSEQVARLDTALVGEPTLRVLKRNEYDQAAMQLAALEKDKPDLKRHREYGEFKTQFDQTYSAFLRHKNLREIRQRLMANGESLPTGDAGSESMVVLDKAEIEAKSRRHWLIFLALLVASVGIMNAMLMSVTERFREIGTMKCLGALDSFILRIFLIESSMQGFIGTLLGVFIGIGFSLIKFWNDYTFGFVQFLPVGEIGKGAIFSLLAGTGISFFAATVPALIAAKMEPVVAMRVDQ